MASIPDSWYDERVRDGVATPEQSAAMKAFLHGNILPNEAARILTTDANQAALVDSPSIEQLHEELTKLWGFLIDFILEGTFDVVEILHAISELPHIDLTGKDSIGSFQDDNGVVREPKLWEDLPKFWNLLSDFWDSLAVRRGEQISPYSEEKENSPWNNINLFAAYAFRVGGRFELMQLLGYWGCYVLKEAATANPESLEIDLTVAEWWLDIAGDELYDHYYRTFKGQFSDEEWKGWAQTFMGISSDKRMTERVRRVADHVSRKLWRIIR